MLNILLSPYLPHGEPISSDRVAGSGEGKTPQVVLLLLLITVLQLHFGSWALWLVQFLWTGDPMRRPTSIPADLVLHGDVGNPGWVRLRTHGAGAYGHSICILWGPARCCQEVCSNRWSGSQATVGVCGCSVVRGFAAFNVWAYWCFVWALLVVVTSLAADVEGWSESGMHWLVGLLVAVVNKWAFDSLVAGLAVLICAARAFNDHPLEVVLGEGLLALECLIDTTLFLDLKVRTYNEYYYQGLIYSTRRLRGHGTSTNGKNRTLVTG